MENKTIKIIKNRVSCKSYSDKKVSLSKVKMIAECGKMAPSGMNRQIPNILVLRSKKYVEKLRELSKELLNRDCFYNASTLLLVYADREDRFCLQDCTCVLENMFIAASSLNIGSCWINQVDDLLSSEKGRKLKKTLHIHDNARIVGTCVLGYPSAGYEMKIKSRKEDYIRYM